MQLKNSHLLLDQQLWEFDLWVTPALTDIRYTNRFRKELQRVLEVLDTLTAGGGNELSQDRYAANLVERTFGHLDSITASATDMAAIANQAEEFLNSLAALLFLVTGKSDNNNKCQFPIYLRNKVGIDSLPNVKTRKGKACLVLDQIPRVIDSESYMTRIARLYAYARLTAAELHEQDAHAQVLLLEFASLLLADEASRAQLSAFLNHYRCSTANGEDASVLLTPLVIFQVRGSVAASGGHEPEEILRRYMQSWGMVRDVDFNIHDVVLDVEAGRIQELDSDADEPPQGKIKTRAYDFVLPFRTPGWTPQIFIQSQFYAGDSGSVSHKNVDQTSTSRLAATKLLARAWPNGPLPRFLEYVDGAGYSASLNGDLKSLLSFADTAGFFQIRSAPVRLRREIQQIGFLTPLEIAHAVLLGGNSVQTVHAKLQEDGYSASEIARGLIGARDAGVIDITGEQVAVVSLYQPTARLFLLLDLIARSGHSFGSLSEAVGVALVPGYGPYYGLTLAELDAEVRLQCPQIWPDGFMSDLQQLCSNGWVLLR